MARLRTALLIVFLFIAWSALAVEKPDKWVSRVQISVSCEDAALKNRIISIVLRELRSLGDVEITDTNPAYKINVVAISLKAKSGYATGNAVSIVISRPQGRMDWALSEALRPDVKESVASMLARRESFEDHRLFVGDDNSLRGSLEEFVADFDVERLEPDRKIWESLK